MNRYYFLSPAPGLAVLAVMLGITLSSGLHAAGTRGFQPKVSQAELDKRKAERLKAMEFNRTHMHFISTPEAQGYLESLIKGMRSQPAIKKGLIKVKPVKITTDSAQSGFGKLCKGDGADTPDGILASQRISAAQFERCQQNGVKGLVEIKLGYEVLALVVNKKAPAMDLDRATLRRALAAETRKQGSDKKPEWQKNTSRKWRDLDPDLPDTEILITLPAEKTPAHDLLQRVIMQPGCKGGKPEAGKKTAQPQPPGPKAKCQAVRNDDRVRAAARPGAVAKAPNGLSVMRYADWSKIKKTGVRLVPVGGVAPNAKTIQSGLYPLASAYYLYIKQDHLPKLPELSYLLVEAASDTAALDAGYLAKGGMLPLSKDEFVQVRTSALRMQAMSAPD